MGNPRSTDVNSGNNSWKTFLENVESVNKTDINNKHQFVVKILEIYPQLIEEISGKSKTENIFTQLKVSIENLPAPHKVGFETALLYVNYLNLAEFELKNYQLEIIKSL